MPKRRSCLSWSGCEVLFLSILLLFREGQGSSATWKVKLIDVVTVEVSRLGVQHCTMDQASSFRQPSP